MKIEPARITDSAERLKRIRPAYGDMLDFYGPLFADQEIRAEKMQPEAKMPENREIAAIRLEKGFPLCSPADFPVDFEAGVDFLHRVCEMATAAAGPLADAAAALSEALNAGRLKPSELFAAILEGDETWMRKAAEDLAADREILAMLGYHSIRPSLLAFSRRLGEEGKIPASWEFGICPVCGSLPAISLLKEEGKRFLVCKFCWHDWPHRRTACPNCRTSDGRKLRYFFDENEPEIRVDLCEACRSYLKTVDTRKAERGIYPPLEALTTLHLDIKAQQMGFSGGSQTVD